MIGCLRTRVRKQPIIALYFESETGQNSVMTDPNDMTEKSFKAMLWDGNIKTSDFDMQAFKMQSATNPIKIGCKIRKLEQFKNQNIEWRPPFDYLILDKPIKSPYFNANCTDFPF